MADWIRLNKIRYQTCHGALPHERTVPQEFLVDVAMRGDLSAAGHSDELADTVDYGLVVDEVTAVMAGRPVNLLEALAEQIAARVIGLSPLIREVVIRVTKTAPPLSAVTGGVQVEIRREA